MRQGDDFRAAYVTSNLIQRRHEECQMLCFVRALRQIGFLLRQRGDSVGERLEDSVMIPVAGGFN